MMAAMEETAAPTQAERRPRRLHAVADAADAIEHASATRFSETVRTVVALSRRRGLRPPVFRSPPRLDGVDRSIRRRPNGTVVVAVRRGARPLAAVQSDIIEGVVAANDLTGEPADRFRHAAWAQLHGVEGTQPPRATIGAAAPSARVA